MCVRYCGLINILRHLKQYHVTLTICASLVVQEASFSFTYLAKQLCNNMFGAAIVLSALIVKVKNAYSSMLIALLGF